MDNFTAGLVKVLMEGGDKGIMAILVLVIMFLVYDRRTLIQSIAKKEEKMEKIVENYYAGNVSITEALTALKITLAEIKGKIL